MTMGEVSSDDTLDTSGDEEPPIKEVNILSFSFLLCFKAAKAGAVVNYL